MRIKQRAPTVTFIAVAAAALMLLLLCGLVVLRSSGDVVVGRGAVMSRRRTTRGYVAAPKPTTTKWLPNNRIGWADARMAVTLPSRRRVHAQDEERKYSFSEEIERYKEDQREKEEKSEEEVKEPPRYSFEEEVGQVVLNIEPPKDLPPPSWERPPQQSKSLGSLRAGMAKAAEEADEEQRKLEAAIAMAKQDNQEGEQGETAGTEATEAGRGGGQQLDDEQFIDEGPEEMPYVASEYQARNWVYPRYADLGPESVDGVLDTDAMLKRSHFIVPRKVMIEKAQELMKALFDGDERELEEQLADDFEFVGPVVGPLDKKEFIRAYTGCFKLKEALPDLKENIFGWQIDPMEPNRVWWFTRSIGSISPSGSRVEWPPQVNSMCFDSNGSVYRLTMGYAVDRKMGNTGGLGAVFGLLNAIGTPLPFREAQPWQPSAKFLFFTKAMPKFRDMLKRGRDMRDRLLEKLDDDEY
eukprot:jgi/Bigna1/133749/aug1.22_g8457